MPDNALARLALQPDEAASFWPSSPAAPLRGVTSTDYARGAGNALVALARALLPPTPNEYMWGMAGYEQPPAGTETGQFDDGRMWQRPPGGEWQPMEQSGLARLSSFLAPLGFGPAPSGAIASGVPLARAAEGAARRARGFTEIDYYGSPQRILQNPTEKEIEGFVGRTKYQAARRIIDPDTGDVYLWDAADPALHQLVAEQLGVRFGKETVADIIGTR